jgi:cation diffusion facilitator CzcD-associated flavoprotein CzcO
MTDAFASLADAGTAAGAERLDVLIDGAGLTGIGAEHHLQ